MPRVPMPPPGQNVLAAVPVCVPYQDPSDALSIEFQSNGYLLPVQYSTGDLSPDIPSGLFSIGDTIGPYKGQAKGASIRLIFVDVNNTTAYTYNITVQENCPPIKTYPLGSGGPAQSA